MTLLPHPIVHHPFAFALGPLQITGFGIAVLLAFLVAQIVAQRELARRGHDPEPVSDMIFAAVIGGLLGAKLYYVVVLGNRDAIFDRGGFVFWGGFIRRRRSPCLSWSCARSFGVRAHRRRRRTGDRARLRGRTHRLLGGRRRLRPAVERLPRRRVPQGRAAVDGGRHGARLRRPDAAGRVAEHRAVGLSDAAARGGARRS